MVAVATIGGFAPGLPRDSRGLPRGLKFLSNRPSLRVLSKAAAAVQLNALSKAIDVPFLKLDKARREDAIRVSRPWRVMCMLYKICILEDYSFIRCCPQHGDDTERLTGGAGPDRPRQHATRSRAHTHTAITHAAMQSPKGQSPSNHHVARTANPLSRFHS